MNRTAPPTARPRWVTVLRWAVVVAAVAFAAGSLVGAWSEVRDEIGMLTVRSLVPAFGLFLVANVVLGVGWYLVLGATGRPSTFGPVAAAEVFGVGQVGKYAPGAVWPVVVQSQIGERHGLRWRVILAAYGLHVALVVAVGSWVGLGSLRGTMPEWLRPLVVAGAALGVAVMVAVAHPGAAHRGLDRVLRRLSGEGLPARPGAAPVAAAATVSFVFWVLLGAHAMMIVSPLGVGWSSAAYVTGCFTLAWVAGVVMVPVPAGVGVREAVLVLTLGQSLGRPAAVTLALVSRLVQVVADLGAAGTLAAFGVIGHARRRPDGPDVVGGTSPEGDVRAG